MQIRTKTLLRHCRCLSAQLVLRYLFSLCLVMVLVYAFACLCLASVIQNNPPCDHLHTSGVFTAFLETLKQVPFLVVSSYYDCAFVSVNVCGRFFLGNSCQKSNSFQVRCSSRECLLAYDSKYSSICLPRAVCVEGVVLQEVYCIVGISAR